MLYDKDASLTVTTIQQLLPMSFGPDDLKSAHRAEGSSDSR